METLCGAEPQTLMLQNLVFATLVVYQADFKGFSFKNP